MADDYIINFIAPTEPDVIDALIERGVNPTLAQQAARSGDWENLTDEQRFAWVVEQVELLTGIDREYQRARNQTGAPERQPSEWRDDLLRLAKAQGFYDGDPGSGQWSDVEREAVSEYQRRRGLAVTGKIDNETVDDVIEVGKFLSGQNRPTGSPTAPSGGDDRVPAFVQGGGQPGSRPVTGLAGGPTGTGAPTGTTPAGTVTANASTGGNANEDGLFSIPGGGEIWKVGDNEWYAVYKVPGTGTPLAWRIETDADLAAIFGPDKTPTPTRTLHPLEFYASGSIGFGTSRLLANTSEHPFDVFVSNFETEARIRPWLRDEEILAVTTRALLEGRQVTDAELAGTNWWRTHTEGERQWLALVNRDPATADQQVKDHRDEVRRLLLSSGVADAPETLVSWLADRWTGGTWSQAYVYGQIAKIADPYAPGEIDEDLAPLLTFVGELDTLSGNVSKVDALLNRWLGPVFAAGWTDSQKESWAGRLRNDPQAEEALTEELKRQRLSLFPEYENPELSYEDIAAPWRGVWTQAWGQQPDESDPLFARIVRGNDLGDAQRLLRAEGFGRGISTVEDEVLAGIGQSALGQTVRGAR